MSVASLPPSTLTTMAVLDNFFSRSKSCSLIAVPLLNIMKHLSLNFSQISSNFGKRNGSPPAKKKPNTPSSLASEIIRVHPCQSSCGFSLLCPPLLHVIPEAAAKHPEQLRLQCFVRLRIKAGGTFKPSFLCFLRSCPVLVYARRSEPADSRYLG